MTPPAAAWLEYEFAGAAEACLGIGDSAANRATLLIVPPLFDEMNRLRRTLLLAMRAMSARGIATRLIDLPGCNESLAPLAGQTLTAWRDAVTAATRQLGATHILSARGGALIDNTAGLPVLRLAPAKGQTLLRTLLRTKVAGERESGRDVTVESLLAEAGDRPLELAGNWLGATMRAELDGARPATEISATDLTVGTDGIAGSPLWLRAEPGEDAAMADALADATAKWIATCAVA